MEASINPTRRIGIEIEVVVPIVGSGSGQDVQRLLAEVLTNQGIRAAHRAYSRQPIPPGCQFAIEYDASLQDESRYQGLGWAKIEAKTAPMTWEEVERVVPPALEVIRYIGARCNASTGLHVHHHLPEVRRRPQVVRSLQHLWWRFHPVMYGLVAPSRRSNQYCYAPDRIDVTQYDACASYPRLRGLLRQANRYHGLNLTNLGDQERMTVEWRLHGGTTDWDKIKAWVLATQRWTEHAVARSCHFKPEPVKNSREGLNALLVTTGLKSNSRIYRKVDKELRQVGKFLLQRWKAFNLPRDFEAKPVAA